MSGQNQRKTNAGQAKLGIYERPERPGVTNVEVIAVLLSAVWIVGAIVFFVAMPGEASAGFDGGSFLVTAFAVFMPVAMIWVAAMTARASRVMREESQRLQSAIDAIRQAYLTQQQRGAVGAEPSSVAKKLEEIAETTKKTETALATFSTIRRETRPHAPATAAQQASGEDQGRLELGTPCGRIVSAARQRRFHPRAELPRNRR